MTTPRNTPQEEAPLVGVRTYADIDRALKDHADRGGSPEFSAGVAAAYEWAMCRTDRSPVTGTDNAHDIPGLPLLTAEVDAAVVQLEDPTIQTAARDYIRGAHDVLAWICGYSDQPA